MKKLNKITLHIEFDEDPDLSYLGVIATKPRYSKIDRVWIPVNPDHPDGDWFSPGNHLPHKEENWAHVSKEDKQRIIEKYGSLRKADIAYAYEDCKRLQRYLSGNWWMEFYTLQASIAVSDDGEHWAYDNITVSIGNIESDGNNEYKQSIINDLKSELTHELKLWNFSEAEIQKAMEEMKNETI